MQKSIPFWMFVLSAFLGGCGLAGEMSLAEYSASGNYRYDDGAADMGTGGDEAGAEKYGDIVENPFVAVEDDAISTFSIDADGASYANARRFLTSESPVPPNAVRAEEFINYFVYDEPEPESGETLGLRTEAATCPWKPENRLLRIAIQGQTIPEAERPASNIVMLVDVSGSMSDELPLVKSAMTMLAGRFGPGDTFSLVTYAGADRVIIDGADGAITPAITAAIDGLDAGGSTAGAAGITTAYEIAESHFIEDGNNRIVLATDGDFNVGISDTDDLIDLIVQKRKTGVFLSVWGVGMGNLNEAMMEQLANNGNGNYEYLDSETEAGKVLGVDFGKMFSVAKDVKVQVRFNPATVEQYRLIGYENRLLADEDFANDATDAGEIGSGQTITALYEYVPLDGAPAGATVATVDLRYKSLPQESIVAVSADAHPSDTAFLGASENFRIAAAAASFALILRDSQYRGDATLKDVKSWVEGASTFDRGDLRKGFAGLLDMAQPVYPDR